VYRFMRTYQSYNLSKNWVYTPLAILLFLTVMQYNVIKHSVFNKYENSCSLYAFSALWKVCMWRGQEEKFQYCVPKNDVNIFQLKVPFYTPTRTNTTHHLIHYIGKSILKKKHINGDGRTGNWKNIFRLQFIWEHLTFLTNYDLI